MRIQIDINEVKPDLGEMILGAIWGLIKFAFWFWVLKVMIWGW